MPPIGAENNKDPKVCKPWGLFFFPLKSLNIFVAFILFYQPLKVLPWKKIHKLREYISTLIHNSLEFVDAYEL